VPLAARKALPLALLMLCAWAPSAFAGTVSLDGSTLTYSAAPGEANRVTVTTGFSAISVSETGGLPVTPGAGCSAVTASSASCQLFGVTSISISTDDGNDTARVNGWIPATFSDGSGNDTMTGGSAGDTFISGSGADILRGSGGVDRVDYSGRAAAVSVTLDNVANDGEVGEGDNVNNDVENVVGGAGNDTISGSSLANDLNGGPGDDTLSGAGGNDRLTGGAGADVLNGGTGTDTADYSDRTAPLSLSIDGAANDGEAGEQDNIGADVENLVGGSGNDFMAGGTAANGLSGGGGNDTLTGGAGNDSLDGGAGDDTLLADGGADTLTGGDGRDLADYSSRTEPLSISLDNYAQDGAAAEGDNVKSDVEDVLGGSGDDGLTGSAVANVLNGGAGNDTIDGGAGDDSLLGDPGNDRLVGGAGDDVFDGGDGIDSADYSARWNPLTLSLDGRANDGEAGEHDNILTSIETLIGGGVGDKLVGDAGPNTLIGAGGNDVLDGGLGADDLQGGTGADDEVDYSSRRANVTVTLDEQPNDGQAGEGDNVRSDVEHVVGGSGNDRLIGNALANNLEGGPGDDVLDGGLGPDVMAGGPGTDTADYSSRTAPVIASLDSRANDGEAGEGDNILSAIDVIRGGRGNDRLTGNTASNTLYGGPGNDALDGSGGDDLLVGEAGRDHLIGGSGRDRLDGGGDGDTFDVSDNYPDLIRCGSGRDSVASDAKDKMSLCEMRHRVSGGDTAAKKKKRTKRHHRRSRIRDHRSQTL
jgi:Ca2+-binding RTX toxin-like protein